MKKIPIILGVVFLVTVIANIYFLTMPYYNGTYSSSDGVYEKSITFNNNVAIGSFFVVGAVREGDGEITVNYQDLHNPQIIKSFEFERKSVFRLDMEVSYDEYVPYTCKEAANIQIGFILIEVFILVVAVIVRRKQKTPPCRTQRQGEANEYRDD